MTQIEFSAGKARDLPLQRVATFLVIAQHMSLVYGHQVWKIFLNFDNWALCVRKVAGSQF